MVNKVKVGVVGLGKMGLLHASIYNALEDTRVVSISESSKLVRNGIKNLNPDINIYDDYNTMLENEKLDAVLITTPVNLHVPISIACVEKGIPFFVEKPLSVSSDQATELVELLNKKPTKNMVGYMTRYVGSFAKGREILDKKLIGSIYRVKASIYVSQLMNKGKGWRYKKDKSGGGVLITQGSHLLDLLYWYFGSVKTVNAQTISYYSTEVEDFAHVLIEFESGLKAWVDCSWSVRHKRTVETTIEIEGENGSLSVSDDAVSLYLEKKQSGFNQGWTNYNPVDLFESVPFDVGGPQYTKEAIAFIKMIKDNVMAKPDVVEAEHIQRIIDSAYHSASTNGSPVVI